MTAGERLEHVRRLAAELGLPLDGLDRLVVPPRLVARLLSVSHSQVEKLVARGELPAAWVGASGSSCWTWSTSCSATAGSTRTSASRLRERERSI